LRFSHYNLHTSTKTRSLAVTTVSIDDAILKQFSIACAQSKTTWHYEWHAVEVCVCV